MEIIFHSNLFVVESTTGAVEVRSSGISVAGSIRLYQCLSPSKLPVSSSRSSIRSCRFPALGFQTISCLYPRKALRFRCKSSQTLLSMKSLIRKSHILSASTLTRVLPSLWHVVCARSLELYLTLSVFRQ